VKAIKIVLHPHVEGSLRRSRRAGSYFVDNLHNHLSFDSLPGVVSADHNRRPNPYHLLRLKNLASRRVDVKNPERSDIFLHDHSNHPDIRCEEAVRCVGRMSRTDSTF